MAPKKNKQQQKLALGDFLSDQSLGSWADEMETQPIAAPSSFGSGERRTFGASSSFGGSGGGDSYADRGFATRPVRESLPLPDRPPYTAHLGNLSFEVMEGDVAEFLKDCNVTSIRLVEDKLDRKPKGFGYVEFGSVDGLKKALELSETQFQGRNIRISIAEPPKERSEAREISDWTRKGPLADLPGQGMRGSSERTGSFNRGAGMDPALDANNERGQRRAFFPEGDGKVRDFGNWDRKGPLSPPPGAESRQGRPPRGPPGENSSSPSWGEGRSDAGSRPPRPERADRPERPERPERQPTAADMDSKWRDKMRPDQPSPAATPDASVPSSPQAATAPVGRPRLNLAKRTVSEAPKEGDKEKDASSGGSSIFGGARPVDTRVRDAEIEKRQKEAQAARKAIEDKAREDKKAKDAAAKEAASASAKDRKPSSSANDKQQYEILRRNNEDGASAAPSADEDAVAEEAAERDMPDASANGDIVADKETKPQELTREVPKDNGKGWRQSPSATPETSAEQLEDDGFTVVGGDKKRGRRGGGRALAS